MLQLGAAGPGPAAGAARPARPPRRGPRHLPDAPAPVRGRRRTRPSRRSATRRSSGRRAVRASAEELDELRLLRQGRARAWPSRCASSSRRSTTATRAVEPDPRAAATDPPAPDKTHITAGSGGFTGMEAIWNYFYWQALSTNALDDVGHVLRLNVIDQRAARLRQPPPTARRTISHCKQWLGPTQPGINDARPDPELVRGGAPRSRGATVPRRPQRRRHEPRSSTTCWAHERTARRQLAASPRAGRAR